MFHFSHSMGHQSYQVVCFISKKFGGKMYYLCHWIFHSICHWTVIYDTIDKPEWVICIQNFCLILGIPCSRELKMCINLFRSLVIEFLLYHFGILNVHCAANFLSFWLTLVLTKSFFGIIFVSRNSDSPQ